MMGKPIQITKGGGSLTDFHAAMDKMIASDNPSEAATGQFLKAIIPQFMETAETLIENEDAVALKNGVCNLIVNLLTNTTNFIDVPGYDNPRMFLLDEVRGMLQRDAEFELASQLPKGSA